MASSYKYIGVNESNDWLFFWLEEAELSVQIPADEIDTKSATAIAILKLKFAIPVLSFSPGNSVLIDSTGG